ncbi:MAG: hypothetical protein IJ910_06230 [Bacteroidaceae bacterium]|nr:hypothetical protein [Bacteroidaceae bacterium]
MKKNIFYMLLLTALTFVVGSCSDDDESTEPTNETPAYLKPGTDARPTWIAPNASLFELRMTVQVELGDTLAAYQSEQDLMCATIDGEVRAVTPPHKTGRAIYYPLFILDNRTGGTISLHYYCDRLHRIYTITNWANFAPSAAPTGESGIYRPCFTTEYMK